MQYTTNTTQSFEGQASADNDDADSEIPKLSPAIAPEENGEKQSDQPISAQYASHASEDDENSGENGCKPELQRDGSPSEMQKDENTSVFNF